MTVAQRRAIDFLSSCRVYDISPRFDTTRNLSACHACLFRGQDSRATRALHLFVEEDTERMLPGYPRESESIARREKSCPAREDENKSSIERERSASFSLSLERLFSSRFIDRRARIKKSLQDFIIDKNVGYKNIKININSFSLRNR